MAAQVCEIAAKADVEFGELGLTSTEKILINIPEGIDLATGRWAALARVDKGIVEVLPVRRLEGDAGNPGPFPMLSTPVLFESLIVHELAHVYIDQTAGGSFVSRLAHEYLAYALQMDQLPEPERPLILQQADISGPVELSEFQEAMLSFAPLRYAAMAWLHFRQRKDPAEFVRRIIEGEVVFHSLRE